MLVTPYTDAEIRCFLSAGSLVGAPPLWLRALKARGQAPEWDPPEGHARGKSRREVRTIAHVEHLFCRACQTWKSMDDFYRSSGQAIGRASYCKPCMSVRSGRWQVENRERVRASRRERYRRDKSEP